MTHYYLILCHFFAEKMLQYSNNHLCSSSQLADINSLTNFKLINDTLLPHFVSFFAEKTLQYSNYHLCSSSNVHVFIVKEDGFIYHFVVNGPLSCTHT